MSQQTAERLYPLLPTIYRLRDAAQGEPLRAFMAVLETEMQRVQEDIRALYKDWFIETCEDWVVPYIADLLGIRRLPAVGGPGFNQRTFVADTLAYRRRKATFSLLPQLAKDLTGWPARVIELFPLVAATQHMERLRPEGLGTVDVRRARAVARIGTAFDSLPHGADVRRISEEVAVRHNLPNVAVFVFRLRAFRVSAAPAFPVPDGTQRHFTFSPVGVDSPLFNPGLPDGGSGQEPELPAPLLPAILAAEPEVRRQLFPPPDPSDDIGIADLSDWVLPPGPGEVFIDPLRGRLAFRTLQPKGVRVSYAYGFGGELGAGAYDLAERVPLDPAAEKLVPVALLTGTLGAAPSTLARVFSVAGPGKTLIEVQDNEVYTAAQDFTVPAGLELTLRAGRNNLPVAAVQLGEGVTTRRITLADKPLTLDGLLISGGPLEIVVPAGKQARLRLVRCTLVPSPSRPSLIVSGGGSLELTMERCITGSLALRAAAPDVVSLSLSDSIVDGTIDVDSATIQRATVVGEVTADVLELGSDTLFLKPITIKFVQRGCLRYSFVPDSSVTPQRYLCQPDLAHGAKPTFQLPFSGSSEPAFQFGDPSYGQLAVSCDPGIRRGASNGGEMGAWNFLHNQEREDNLRAALDEYLRLGYEAGIFFVT